MHWVELIADRKVREAQDEGKFDNLPGKGRPLRLDMEPGVPAELRAANRLLKEAGVAPDWILLEKELRARRERTATRLAAFASARERALRALSSLPPSERARAASRADRERDLALLQAAREAVAENALISRLNLLVPVLSRQQPRVNVRARLQALEELYPRLTPPAGEPPWEAVARAAEPPRPTTTAGLLGNRVPLRRARRPAG
jgi:hypothetical protein